MNRFPDSVLAHQLLDGLNGVEVGGAAHNPFNIPGCRNIDRTDSMTTVFKLYEFEQCGQMLNVDIVAEGDVLPFNDDELDYVINAHVIEHFFDPIKAVDEWLRVVKPGGYVFIICPHPDRHQMDEGRPMTSIQELLDRHSGKIENPHDEDDRHQSVWRTVDFLKLCKAMGWKVAHYQEVDDKARNGFTVVIQK